MGRDVTKSERHRLVSSHAHRASLVWRANGRLLDVFARFLPDLKATFSIFDQPQIYLSWARRASLVKLGLENERESLDLL